MVINQIQNQKEREYPCLMYFDNKKCKQRNCRPIADQLHTNCRPIANHLQMFFKCFSHLNHVKYILISCHTTTKCCCSWLFSTLLNSFTTIHNFPAFIMAPKRKLDDIISDKFGDLRFKTGDTAAERLDKFSDNPSWQKTETGIE